MYKAMILCEKGKCTLLISSFLREFGFTHIEIVDNPIDAKKLLDKGNFAIVIINMSLNDESTANFAMQAIKGEASIIMLVGNENTKTYHELQKMGVLVFEKSIDSQLLYKAIRIALATHRRIIGAKKESKQLQKKLEEVKVLDRAKYILIQYLSMSESQAHRFIEKQAMDMRISKVAVARGYIENL